MCLFREGYNPGVKIEAAFSSETAIIIAIEHDATTTRLRCESLRSIFKQLLLYCRLGHACGLNPAKCSLCGGLTAQCTLRTWLHNEGASHTQRYPFGTYSSNSRSFRTVQQVTPTLRETLVITFLFCVRCVVS
jgi:hypothetical protein